MSRSWWALGEAGMDHCGGSEGGCLGGIWEGFLEIGA